MKYIVEEKDGFVEMVKFECTPLEAIVLLRAMNLSMSANNDEMHEDDKDIMMRMLKTVKQIADEHISAEGSKP